MNDLNEFRDFTHILYGALVKYVDANRYIKRIKPPKSKGGFSFGYQFCFKEQSYNDDGFVFYDFEFHICEFLDLKYIKIKAKKLNKARKRVWFIKGK